MKGRKVLEMVTTLFSLPHVSCVPAIALGDVSPIIAVIFSYMAAIAVVSDEITSSQWLPQGLKVP